MEILKSYALKYCGQYVVLPEKVGEQMIELGYMKEDPDEPNTYILIEDATKTTTVFG